MGLISSLQPVPIPCVYTAWDVLALRRYGAVAKGDSSRIADDEEADIYSCRPEVLYVYHVPQL